MVKLVTVRILRNESKQLVREIFDLSGVGIPQLTKKMAEAGANHARSIAPKRTGALIQGIGLSSKTNSDRKGRFTAGSQILSRTPENIRNNNPYNAPYQYFLEYGRTVNVRGGRVQRYMAATVEWLEKEFEDEMSRQLDKAFK